MASEKIEESAIRELSAMDINQRKAAVADDVRLRKDRYAIIDSIELAALLGIDEARCPGTGNAPWSFYRYVEKFSISEHLENTDSFWTSQAYAELKQVVTEERLQEISELDDSDEICKPGFCEERLTEQERDIILNTLYDEALEDGPYCPICRSGVTTDDGFELNFEGDIEDDGVCLGLLTPYDQRDGKFVDLDSVEYVDW